MIWESRLWRPRSLISKINWGALAFIHISSVHFHMLKTHYFALLYFANYHKNLFFFVFVNIYIINHYVSDMVTLAASHPLGMTRSTRTKSVRKTRNYTSKILLKNHTPAIIHLAGFDACHQFWHSFSIYGKYILNVSWIITDMRACHHQVTNHAQCTKIHTELPLAWLYCYDEWHNS